MEKQSGPESGFGETAESGAHETERQNRGAGLDEGMGISHPGVIIASRDGITFGTCDLPARG